MRFSTTQSRIMAMVSAVITCALAMSGCNSNAGTAAIAVGSVAAAGFVGAQVSTYSKIDVQVDVYNESAQLGVDSSHFRETAPLAISEIAERARKLDPTIEPSKTAFLTVAQQLQPIMEGMSQSVDALKKSQANLSNLEALKEAHPDLAAFVDDLKSIENGATKAIEKWEIFRSKMRNLAQREFTVEEAASLGGMLQELRTALADKTRVRFSDASVDIVRLAVGEGMKVDVPEGDRQRQVDAARDALEERMKKVIAPGAEARTAGAQAAPYLAAVLDLIHDKIKHEGTRKDVTRSIAKALNGLGFGVTAEDIEQAYVPGNPSRTQKALADVLDGAGISQAVANAAAIQHAREEAHRATFVKLSTDFNIGGIRNEVMQVLMTSAAVPDITAPQNQGNWQNFSHAWSEGRTGNHDAVIFFEHLGLPVLKSAGFDPTKFVVANGQMFRKAFSAMASVYGVAPPGVSVDANGKTLMSYNIGLAEENRKTQLAATEATQGQIIKGVESVRTSGVLVADEAAKVTPDVAVLKTTAAKALTDALEAVKKEEKEKKDENKK